MHISWYSIILGMPIIIWAYLRDCHIRLNVVAVIRSKRVSKCAMDSRLFSLYWRKWREGMIYVLSLLRDKRGVSSLEYAVLAGIVIAVLSTALGNTAGDSGLGAQILALFVKINNLLTAA